MVTRTQTVGKLQEKETFFTKGVERKRSQAWHRNLADQHLDAEKGASHVSYRPAWATLWPCLENQKLKRRRKDIKSKMTGRLWKERKELQNNIPLYIDTTFFNKCYNLSRFCNLNKKWDYDQVRVNPRSTRNETKKKSKLKAMEQITTM